MCVYLKKKIFNELTKQFYLFIFCKATTLSFDIWRPCTLGGPPKPVAFGSLTAGIISREIVLYSTVALKKYY